eukprot:1777951-Amphidinium_carterae.2
MFRAIFGAVRKGWWSALPHFPLKGPMGSWNGLVALVGLLVVLPGCHGASAVWSQWNVAGAW